MPSSRIGKYISILNRQSQKYLHHLVEQYGIGYSSYYFVMYIGSNPKCSQREMCDSMAMDQAMATREMRRLEQCGYIIRKSVRAMRRLMRFLFLIAGRGCTGS